MRTKFYGTKNKIWDRALLPVIFSLAGPAMLEMAMSTAVQYIDTAMVGAIGTEATAAVGATGTVAWLVGGTISAFGVGFLAYIAQRLGAGDQTRAQQAAAQSVLAVLVSGLFFTALTLGLSRRVPVWMQVDPSIRTLAGTYFFIVYLPMLFRAASTIFGTVLRAAGDAKTPMRVGILVNLINIVLNFLLIYEPRTLMLFSRSIPIWGAGWGVVGAAVASAVSFVFGGAALTVSFYRHPVISPRGLSLRPDPQVLRPVLRISVPNMLQRFGTSLGYVAFASMINALGPVSAAAHTIANTVESAFYVPGYGMMQAAATLTGNCLGARDLERQKRMSGTILIVETGLMLVSGAALFAFAPPLVGLFSKDAAVIALGSLVLRMVACSEPFFGASIALEGMLQGAGVTKMPFWFNMLGMWGVRILGTWICTVLFSRGLVSAWACMIGHNLLLFLMFGGYYLFGNWKNAAGRLTEAADES